MDIYHGEKWRIRYITCRYFTRSYPDIDLHFIVWTSSSSQETAMGWTPMFLSHVNVFCDLLLNTLTATWNLFVLFGNKAKCCEWWHLYASVLQCVCHSANHTNNDENIVQEQVGKMKKSYDHQLFLKSLPLGFKQFLDHIYKLKYEDKPDYKVKEQASIWFELWFHSCSQIHVLSVLLSGQWPVKLPACITSHYCLNRRLSKLL